MERCPSLVVATLADKVGIVTFQAVNSRSKPVVSVVAAIGAVGRSEEAAVGVASASGAVIAEVGLDGNHLVAAGRENWHHSHFDGAAVQGVQLKRWERGTAQAPGPFRIGVVVPSDAEVLVVPDHNRRRRIARQKAAAAVDLERWGAHSRHDVLRAEEAAARRSWVDHTPLTRHEVAKAGALGYSCAVVVAA